MCIMDKYEIKLHELLCVRIIGMKKRFALKLNFR